MFSTIKGFDDLDMSSSDDDFDISDENIADSKFILVQTSLISDIQQLMSLFLLFTYNYNRFRLIFN